MKKFRDFESARKFARKLGLKTQKEWIEYCKSGDKPDDIPATPQGVYKNKGWTTWGEFLGTGTVAFHLKQYRPFKEAREFARELKLKGQVDWNSYVKSGNKPDDIPSKPDSVYKNKGWISLGDWLGTGRTRYSGEFRPFKDAREFARSLGLKSSTKWHEYCKSGNKPDDIPSGPEQVYKNKGWVSWGDFLGTGNVALYNIQFRPFKDAREFVRSLGIQTWGDWREYCKSGNKPDNIPANPQSVYKKEWKGWGDWVGSGKTLIFRPFKEAREFVRKLGLNGQKEWYEYCKSGNKPQDIPVTGSKTYKKEWKGWGDFLGTGNVANFNKQYRPFKEAREFVRSLGIKNRYEWDEYCKSGNKPDDIPSNPHVAYKKWNIDRRKRRNEKV